MKSKVILLLSTLVLTGYGFGQTTFETTVSTDTSFDAGYDVTKVGSTYIVGGRTYKHGIELDSYYALFDEQGTLIQDSILDFSPEANDKVIVVEPYSADRFLIGGHLDDTISGGRNAFVSLIDTLGNMVWYTELQGNLIKSVTDLIVVSSGDIYGFGTTNSFGGDFDFFLVKLSATGSVVWEKGVGYPQEEEHGGRFDIDFNESKLLLGGDRDNSSTSNLDGVIYQVDTSGNIEWSQIWSGSSSNSSMNPKYVSQDRIVGYGMYDGDGYIAALDTLGTVLNDTTLTNQQIQGGRLYDADTMGGAVYLVGSNYSGAMLDQGWLVKASLSGQVQWYLEYGDTHSQLMNGIEATSEKTLALAGTFHKGTYPELQDVWLLVVDSMGCVTPGCNDVGITDQSISSTIQVFSSQGMTIQVRQQGNETIRGSIELYNILGEQVGNNALHLNAGEGTSMQFNGLSSGIYVYRIVEKGAVMGAGKLVMQE